MDVDFERVYADPEYAALPEKQRDRVQRLLLVLRAAEPKPGSRKPRMCGASGLYGRMAAACPCSEAMARVLWERWQQSGGDWRALYDKRATPAQKLSASGRALARAKEEFRKLAEGTQRSTRAAIAAFRTLMENGEIPGFEEYAGKAGVIPPGLSDTSLRECLRAADLKRKRLGIKAAMDELPSIFHTRKDLLPGQIYEFDDVQHDNYVKVGYQSVRVLEFGCQDVASGYILHHGACAAVRRGEKEDGMATPGKPGTRQGLDGKMALAFIGYVLRYIGFSAQGCLLKLEHGTTTLPQSLIEQLEGAGLGLRIVCGGINGWQQAKLGGYTGTPGGNPHNKSHKEQQWSTMHNMLAFAPGQTGKDRQHAPEETAGMLKQAELANWLELALRAKRMHNLADCLYHPFFNFAQYMALLNQKYIEFNRRRDHAMEGYELRQIPLYLTPAGWQTERELTGGRSMTPEEQDYYRAHPDKWRMARMTPEEVWNTREDNEWRHLPLSLYVAILREKFLRKCEVRGGYISLQDRYVSEDKLNYEAQLYTPAGSRVPLENGTKLLCIINPVLDAPLVVISEDGRILGECAQVGRISPLDSELNAERMGRLRSLQVQAEQGQALRWEKETRIIHARQEYNKELARMAGVPLRPTPAQKKLTHAQAAASPLPGAGREAAQEEQEESEAYLPEPAGLGLDEDYEQGTFD